MSNYSNKNETLFAEGQLSTADLQAVVGGGLNILRATIAVSDEVKLLDAADFLGGVACLLRPFNS